MIRNAELKDAESISLIIVKAWQNAYRGIINPDFPRSMTTDKFVSIMTDNITNKKEKVFVYEEENIIKGFVSGKLIHDKYDCETVGLYISPEYQQQGIGKMLLDEIKNYFKNKNCKTMIIWTLQDAENNSFYKKQNGKISEGKELEIGNRVYPGIGFVFHL